MDAVAILRNLWERRLLVAIGLVFASAVAIGLTHRVGVGLPPKLESRQYQVGVASAEVLVDSPNSQVIDLGGSDVSTDVATLSVRARLLADLLASNALKDRIARRAGIAPHLLVALPPASELSVEPTALETGATVSASDPRAHVLSMRVQEELPIIGVDSQAPDRTKAAQISNAAVTELSLYLEHAASNTGIPSSRKLVIEPLGPARSSISHLGPGRMLGLVAGILAFAIWCAGVLGVSGLVRGLRQPAGDSSTAQAPPEAPVLPRPPARQLTPVAPPTRLDAGPEAPFARPPRPRDKPDLDLPERPDRTAATWVA